MSYTKREIINNYHLVDNNLENKRFIKYCQSIGLYIEKNEEESTVGKFRYNIIKDELNLPNEVWVDSILQGKEKYEVSNLGRCRNKTTKRLKGYSDQKGYIGVSMGKSFSNIRLHRLIWFSFHPEYWENEQDFVIDHINGQRDDNRLDNLRMLTARQNVEAREQNNNPIQALTAQLIQQYGYDETINKLKGLL